MIVYFPYENYKRDSLSRLYLSSFFSKKFGENVEIQIGWYKDLFANIFANLKKDFGKKKIIIDCNNFLYKYPVIKLLKKFNFHYFVIDEEEVGLTYFRKKKYLTQRHLSDFSKFVDGKFFLSKKIYDEEKKSLFKKKNENLFLTSHPRIDFIKNYKKIFSDKKKNFKYYLICMPDSYYRYIQSLCVLRKGHIFKNKPLKNYILINNRKKVVASFLKLSRDIIKKYPNKKFLIRPHPSDLEFKKLYLKIFDKYKNVKIVFDYSSLHYINNAELVFCGLDFCAVEANLLNKKGIVFHKSFDKSFYKNHFSHGLSNFDYTNNKEIFLKIFKKMIKDKNKNKTYFDKKLNTLLLVQKNSSDEICKIVSKIIDKENKRKMTSIDSICYYFLKPILRYIKSIKSKKYNQVSEMDYINYLKKFRYSFSNVILRLLIDKALIYSLYKTICFSNFHEHSAYRMSGQEQKIDKYYFKYIKLISSKIKMNKKIKISKNKLWLKIS